MTSGRKDTDAENKAGDAPAPAKPPANPPANPTKDAPFDVDLGNDGDFASPRQDLDEQELKEQQDRRP